MLLKIQEPLWGQKLLLMLNGYVRQHQFLMKIIPIMADVFVFSYPIYLVAIYLWGLFKKNQEYNIWALYIFFSAVFAIMINLVIQHFVFKLRPEQLVLTKSELIFQHVPDRPFPSDHASLSSAIAMATLLWWFKTGSRFFIISWIIFWIFSAIMCIARVAAGVHWPTDILAGLIVWIFIASILNYSPIFEFMKIYIYQPLIVFSKVIFRISN